MSVVLRIDVIKPYRHADVGRVRRRVRIGGRSPALPANRPGGRRPANRVREIALSAIPVAVLATDPILNSGLTAQLRCRPDVVLVAPPEAAVVLIAADLLDGQLIGRQAGGARRRRARRLVWLAAALSG